MRNLDVSDESIKGLALELGVPVEFQGGGVFNSTGSKGVLPRVSKEKTAADQTQQLLSRLVDIAARQPAGPESPQVTVHAPTPPSNWTFTFERNDDGTIKSIRAEATK